MREQFLTNEVDLMKRKILEIRPIEVFDYKDNGLDRIIVYIKCEYDKYGNDSIIQKFKSIGHPLYSEEKWVFRRYLNRWIVDDIVEDIILDVLKGKRCTENSNNKLAHGGIITYIRSSGAIYEGNLINGMMNGVGAMEWSNGDKYCGGFLNDKRNGHGTYIWSDGSSYDGNWKDDMMAGYGIYVNKDGVKQTGYWMNGEYIGENESLSSE